MLFRSLDHEAKAKKNHIEKTTEKNIENNLILRHLGPPKELRGNSYIKGNLFIRTF